MKTCVLPVLYLLASLILSACSNRHFITDPNERIAIQEDFDNRKKELQSGNLFNIFNNNLPNEELEALTFLYAYMPLCDLTDYPGSFHHMNVSYALKTREEMPWGKTIPEREFRHFVLPVRVNNENLDESRAVFFNELKDRVKHLSLHDAVLEVNHWCHEKVVYTPTDIRTGSPLATVRTAYGRCGEESTFLVAALRSVGIPARQVYTPRWAHTNSNHAWVEAWVDGEWHFLGACEPEPILNLGWFNAPAARGMLMHTKVFGRYNGPEEVISQTTNYTEINIIDNYAPKAQLRLKVQDKQGNAIPNLPVDFKIYNYAEFFTAVSKETDSQGEIVLSAGQGDMIVYAAQKDHFGFKKISFRQSGVDTLVLNRLKGEAFDVQLEIVPPVERHQLTEVTPEQRAHNTLRLEHEDSIRNAYTATFPSKDKALSLASELKIDSSRWISVLTQSRGNHAVITDFMRQTPAEKRDLALRLLSVISKKDLGDIPLSVLTDHLNETQESELTGFDEYILNPRVSNEWLTPYKSYFKQQLSKELSDSIRQDPLFLVDWCNKNLCLRDDLNSQQIPITPIGIWNARCTDTPSRDIFFVAVLRTLGIPARIDRITGKLQYAKNESEWQDIIFSEQKATISSQGKLFANYTPIKSLSNPGYYTHFSLSRYENGSFQLLNFPQGEQGCWNPLLKNGVLLDEGYYMLVTGTRMANGSVLSNVSFFNIKSKQATHLDLVMLDSSDEIKVIGEFNSEAEFYAAKEQKTQSFLQTAGRGYFITAILGQGDEPSNHALRDIALLKKDFEQWNRSLVFLFPDQKQLNKFNPAEFPNLPHTVVYGTDNNRMIEETIAQNMELPQNYKLPVFIISDTFNRVVFVSQGYTIGLGEQLMKVIHKL